MGSMQAACEGDLHTIVSRCSNAFGDWFIAHVLDLLALHPAAPSLLEQPLPHLGGSLVSLPNSCLCPLFADPDHGPVLAKLSAITMLQYGLMAVSEAPLPHPLVMFDFAVEGVHTTLPAAFGFVASARSYHHAMMRNAEQQPPASRAVDSEAWPPRRPHALTNAFICARWSSTHCNTQPP